MKVTVATSIAPKNIELQKKAIATWQELGFDVISINSAREIQQLEASFPAVNFVEATRDASAIAGKPYVFFDDVLSALKSSSSEICGIVNSDIYLLDKKLVDVVVREGQKAFLFGSRVDIPSLDRRDGRFHFWGFDFFFFNRSVIDIYSQTDFCLGAPSWDYWAVLLPMVKGVAVKQLISPCAFHVRHPARYDYELVNRFGREMLGNLERKDLSPSLDRDLAIIVREAGSRTGFDIIALKLCDYILRKTPKLTCGPAAEASSNEEEMYCAAMSREFRMGLIYQSIRTCSASGRKALDQLSTIFHKITKM